MTTDPAAAQKIREELGGLAAARRKAERARARAMERTTPLVRAGHEAGITPTELAAITGLSRRAVYDILSPDRGSD